MQKVRNRAGKLVCCVDSRNRIIEIVQRGIRTVVRFLDDGTYEVYSTDVKRS